MSTRDTALLLRTAALGVAILMAASAGWFISAATSAAQPGDVSCDGNVDSIDAALVLQFSAGLIHSLPCPGKADASGDGVTDALDAALILQYAAGILNDLNPSSSTERTTYQGTTATGGEVRFVLSEDGSQVLAFVAEWRGGFCGGRYVGRLPVTGSFFSRSGERFTFTGVLEPPDSASGTVSDTNCKENVPWSATVD